MSPAGKPPVALPYCQRQGEDAATYLRHRRQRFGTRIPVSSGDLIGAVVENPSNGHAHAVWALSAPFARTEYAKRKPLAYAAAVTEGLRRSVDGDKGYSGLITKNPEHTAWDSHWITDKLYSLDELSFWLEETGFMPPESWKKTRRKSLIGLGRNCALFESARTWAYPMKILLSLTLLTSLTPLERSVQWR